MAGDWSIFGREARLVPTIRGRKHGPVPLAAPKIPQSPTRRRFLDGLAIPDFARRLADPDSRESLVQAVASYVQV